MCRIDNDNQKGKTVPASSRNASRSSDRILALLLLLLLAGAATYVCLRYRALAVNRDFLTARTPERLVKVISKYEASHPEAVEEARIRLADQYMNAKRFSEARAVYAAIIEKATYPEIRRLAAFNSASAYVIEGYHANAAAAFTALLAEPQLPLAMRAEASFALAGELRKAGRPEEAVPVLARLFETARTSGDPEASAVRKAAVAALKKLHEEIRTP